MCSSCPSFRCPTLAWPLTSSSSMWRTLMEWASLNPTRISTRLVLRILHQPHLHSHFTFNFTCWLLNPIYCWVYYKQRRYSDTQPRAAPQIIHNAHSVAFMSFWVQFIALSSHIHTYFPCSSLFLPGLHFTQTGFCAAVHPFLNLNGLATMRYS